jgi:hypothetical protein
LNAMTMKNPMKNASQLNQSIIGVRSRFPDRD